MIVDSPEGRVSTGGSARATRQAGGSDFFRHRLDVVRLEPERRGDARRAEDRPESRGATTNVGESIRLRSSADSASERDGPPGGGGPSEGVRRTRRPSAAVDRPTSRPASSRRAALDDDDRTSFPVPVHRSRGPPRNITRWPTVWARASRRGTRGTGSGGGGPRGSAGDRGWPAGRRPCAPCTGRSRRGAISASGARTNRRTAIRGWGTISSIVLAAAGIRLVWRRRSP